jgi:hypothetical protein
MTDSLTSAGGGVIVSSLLAVFATVVVIAVAAAVDIGASIDVGAVVAVIVLGFRGRPRPRTARLT